MTARLRAIRWRRQRQRRQLWFIGIAMFLPLLFVSFEAWLMFLIVGVILAVPILGFGLGLVDMIYCVLGGYDRHARRSRAYFEKLPPISDDDIPADEPQVAAKRKRGKRAKKSKIAWKTNHWIRPGAFR